MEKHLEGLNTAQLEAVENTEGPTLIVAGAGAGKTKTITSRIVHLIHKGIAPHHILAITFTNKAASEMRERILHALAHERQSTTPHISTFHSLGVSILREHAHLVGRNKYFSILDESDSTRLVKEAIIECDLDIKQYEPKRFKNIISKEKGNFMTIEKYSLRETSYTGELVAKIWARYEAKVREEKAFDFDDLLLESVLLLKKNPEIRKMYHDRFQYIHVDEYQDTNEVQYELTKLLAGEKHNICVVGDTDQNIYSWRGAQIKNMLHFEKDFPNAKTFFLEQNYRSTQTILKTANAVIEKNTVRVPKTLFTENGEGEGISLFENYDEVAEAEIIVDTVTELLDKGILPETIALLYRANFQSRALEEAFLSRGLQYQVLGTKFYDRKEVKDVLAYIRGALAPDNLSDIKRIINIPTRGLGKVSIAKLFSGKATELPVGTQQKINNFYALLEKMKIFIEGHTPSEIVTFVMKETGIETMLKSDGAEGQERLENIGELITLAKKYDVLDPERRLEKLLDDAALASDQDALKEGNGVKLMTVHASKGLEFDYIFITGLEQDLFPHARNEGATIEDKEEERRLFYVALTRARTKIFLTYATIRTLFGMRQVNTPSEFLYDIPEEYLIREHIHQAKTKVIYFD